MKKMSVLNFKEWLLATHNYLPEELDDEMHFEFLKDYVYDYITDQVDQMWEAKI